VSFAVPARPGRQNEGGGVLAPPSLGRCPNHLRTMRVDDVDAVVHIFAACPNSLLFFLGQHHQGIGPCIVYEFAFDWRAHEIYQPSSIFYY
jgi:hypothetical protein